MIELSVSLASSGTAKLAGYEQMLRFGYTKNRGVYRLHIEAAGEWKGLAVRCFWHTPDGKDPPSSLVVDGFVDVPASVTAQPGNGCITFEGSDGTKTVTSADLRYRVAANSGTEDGTEPEPGTPAWQAFVEAVKSDASAAVQAANDAATSASNADAFASAAKSSSESAAESAAAAAFSESAAGQSATAASDSAAEATRQAELAAQAAESKGFLYLEDNDNSGILSLVVSDSLTDDVTLQDNGQGILEVVYK